MTMVAVMNGAHGCHASSFEVNARRGWCWGRLSCMFRGKHNVLNATAAVAIGVQLGI